MTKTQQPGRRHCLLQLIALLVMVESGIAVDEQVPPTGRMGVDSLGDLLPEFAVQRFGTLRFRHPSSESELALSPDDSSVVTAGRTLIVWDAKTGKERWRSKEDNRAEISGASYGARAVCFSSDGQEFLTPAENLAVVVWKSQSGVSETISVQVPDTIRKFTNDGPISNAGPRCVDLSSDDKLMLYGSAQGLFVCDRTGKLVFHEPNKPEVPISSDAMNSDRLLFGGDYSLGRFSPDSSVIACTTSDHPTEIRLLNAKDGSLTQRIELKKRMVRLDFSPDSKQLAVTERDSAVRLYETTTGQEIWSHVFKLQNPYENYTSGIAYSPDGKVIAVAATDLKIYLLNATTGDVSKALSGHSWYPWSLEFSHDGATLYSVGWDGPVRRWDVASGRQLGPPTGFHAAGVVALSPNGETLSCVDDGQKIHVTTMANSTPVCELAIPDAEWNQLAYSPDGKWLAAGGNDSADVVVAVWDLTDGVKKHEWKWPQGRDPHSTVKSLEFSPDGHKLAAAVFRQSAAYIWDLPSQRPVLKVDHNEVYGLSFSADSASIATAGWDKRVRVFDPDTGDLKNDTDLESLGGGIDDPRMYAVKYSPDGRRMATAHMDGNVVIWNVIDTTEQCRFRITGRFVHGAIAFSPDSRWLATGSAGGNVEVWDVSTAAKVCDAGRHEHYVNMVGFGRDSRTLASGGSDGVVYLWDLFHPSADDSAEQIRKLAGSSAEDAWQARWALLQSPESTVKLIAEKLSPITTVIDLKTAAKAFANDEEDVVERTAAITAMIAADEKIEELQIVKRYLVLLVEINTPDSIELLTELAGHDPSRIQKLAEEALQQVPSKD